MSQWVKKRQEVLKDVKHDLLEKALADMGLRIDARTSVSNSWGSDTVSCGLTRIEGNEQLPIGLHFEKQDGLNRAELRGDFFMTGLKERTFMDEMAQQYQKHNITEQLECQGWNIDDISTNDKDEIVMEAYQWV